MTTASYWKYLSRLVGEDRRKEKRVLLVYPIEVHGFDRHGKFFCERTTTSNISAEGCRFHLQAEVELGAIVAVSVLRSQASAPATRALLYQIVWTEPQENGREAGACKLQEGDLWQVVFPERVAKPSETE
ncbi:MAG: PilZ domain-containing protein [Firmicutes bacterium]|nr:PilZ domain-containing protein [Bacillota bacterium]